MASAESLFAFRGWQKDNWNATTSDDPHEEHASLLSEGQCSMYISNMWQESRSLRSTYTCHLGDFEESEAPHIPDAVIFTAPEYPVAIAWASTRGITVYKSTISCKEPANTGLIDRY